MTRGGIAAAAGARFSVRGAGGQGVVKKGARVFALPCRGAGWCAWGRPVTRAGAEAQVKGGAAVMASCREVGASGDAGRSERAGSRARGRRRES
jgi:hypothetical protein